MSSEIEVPETPNWLQELEAKRERRLKARLAHETGAGAPCLKCGDKCPGLDLHFWRKCCKICKCAKEEHEVQDDDIYGWTQFQLLGSKPNKIKTKIVLPGKKDEVELDWAPKGHKDTVDKYLKTLPPDQLPVKGSQAAQDRKQLLQKQIPIHDIDPTLCHELNEDELKKMNDYVAHVKQASVGVGQIVSLSSIIKDNLHKLNPSEAAIITSRYAKGIPLSEIVKLQSQDKANMLKPQNINQNMEKLSISDAHNKSLPNYVPNALSTTEQNLNPLVGNKFHDVNYPGYTRDVSHSLPAAQFSSGLKPGQYKGYIAGQTDPAFDPTIDEKYLQGTNFDPKSLPSHFMSQSLGRGGQSNLPYKENLGGYKSGDAAGPVNSAFVPYTKVSSGGFKPGESYKEANYPTGVNYSSSLPRLGKNTSAGFKSGDFAGQNIPHNKLPSSYLGEQNYGEDPQHPNFAKNLGKVSPNHNISPGLKPDHSLGHILRSHSPMSGSQGKELYENTEEMKRNDPQSLPNYAPSKFNVQSEVQSPTKVPKNVRDLAFSTYDERNVNPNEQEYNLDPNLPQNIYRQPGASYGNYPSGLKPGNVAAIANKMSDNVLGGQKEYYPGDLAPENTSAFGNKMVGNVPGRSNNYYPSGFGPENSAAVGNKPLDNMPTKPSDYYRGGSRPENTAAPNNNPLDSNIPERPINYYPSEFVPENSAAIGNKPLDNVSAKPSDYYRGGFRPENTAAPNNNPLDTNVPERPINYYPSGFRPDNSSVVGNKPLDNVPANLKDYSGGFRPVQPGGPTFPSYDQSAGQNDNYPTSQNYPSGPFNQNIPGQPPNVSYQNYPGEMRSGTPTGREAVPYGSKPNKKLSELHPGKINIDEDFLHPSQVNIGAIQDINYPEIKAATHGTNDFYEDYSPDSLREILNNIILPDCHYCKKPFEENEFAITIDRANVLFHAECFKCAGCNQILADNVYFYNKETDNIYCGRDYAKIRGFPRCKACDELIFTKEYCLAENSTFHLKHFCCIECDKPLAGQDYTLEDEMPYCLPCFEQSKASKCSSCFRVIKPDEMGCTLNGVHFHASDGCFACKVCKKPLMGKKLLLRNEKLYCSHDCFGADK